MVCDIISKLGKCIPSERVALSVTELGQTNKFVRMTTVFRNVTASSPQE
jgi:hypothetical protein